MFVYNYEHQLQKHILDNFNYYFDYELIGSNIPIKYRRGKRVDILAKDKETIYIIELKRDFVTQKTLEQLNLYIEEYETEKNVIGIAAAPKTKKNLDLDRYENKIIIKELPDVRFEWNSSDLYGRKSGSLKQASV